MDFDEALDQFLAHTRVERGLAENTIQAYGTDLVQLATWLALREIERIEDLTPDHINDFLVERLDSGDSNRTLARKLVSLRQLYRFLRRERRISVDPTEVIDAPSIGRPLPVVLTEGQVEALLNAPDPDSPEGSRDRAMLEVLYATGPASGSATGFGAGLREGLEGTPGSLVCSGRTQDRKLPW